MSNVKKMDTKKNRFSSVLAIDPSINNCGIAIFKLGKLTNYKLLHPSAEVDSTDYLAKSKSIFNTIRKIVEIKSIDRIVLEIPTHWGTSGYQARESGSIYKVTFVCGMIYSLDNVVTVTPHMWKGQLPKDVMKRRYILKYPDLDIAGMDHNILDAIGIGHWYTKGKV